MLKLSGSSYQHSDATQDKTNSNQNKSVASEAGQKQVPKTISAKKAAANQLNAQKSTGPKTLQGKERSRWNAVKHGLLSKKLAAIDAKGSLEYFDVLENLREDLQPRGTLEEIFVEKIAIDYWRLKLSIGHEVDLEKKQCCSLPMFEQISRYTNSINRQLIQGANQLERIQQLRSGESVAAPVTIDVNVNGFIQDDAEAVLLEVPKASTTIEPAGSACKASAHSPEEPSVSKTPGSNGKPFEQNAPSTTSQSTAPTFEAHKQYGAPTALANPRASILSRKALT